MSILFPEIARRNATQTLRRAIARKNAWSYVLLSCGHYTTTDVKHRYENWAPAGKPYYCGEHDEYFARARKPRRRNYPQEPPF